MTPDRRTRLAPLAGAVGFGVGLVAWRVLLAVLASMRDGLPESVERARELGIVSFTVLAGYDKHQEVVAWVAGCVIVPVAAWAAWTAVHPAGEPGFRVGRRRRGPRRGGDEEKEPLGPFERRDGRERRGLPRWLPWVGVAGTLIALAARPGFLRGPSPWGTFGLLGEEGVYLGAVQALRSGRVLYADLDFPYGPLLIGSLDVWMRVFGDTVVVARSWVLVLHLAGVGGAALVVRALLGPKVGPWSALGATLALALVAPLFLPNLNAALARPLLAFAPGALLFGAGRAAWYRALDVRVEEARAERERAEADPEDATTLVEESTTLVAEPEAPPSPPGLGPLWRCPWIWAGALLPIAASISFEIGPAAAAGLVVALVLVRPGRDPATRVGVGFAVAALAVLVPMAFSGSLGGLFAHGRNMLALPALGYQALPYPDSMGLFADASGAFGTYAPANPAAAVWAAVPPLVIWAGLAVCQLETPNWA